MNFQTYMVNLHSFAHSGLGNPGHSLVQKDPRRLLEGGDKSFYREGDRLLTFKDRIHKKITIQDMSLQE